MSENDEQREFIQQLFERYRGSLQRYVTGLLSGRSDAEDIVQETAARMLSTPALELHEARARSFMFRIATNLAYDRHRRRHEQSIEDIGEMHCEADATYSPDQIVDIDQALDSITKTLLALKPRCRRVFLLRTAEGLDFDTIASRLRVSRRTVEREMRHALDACQRRLRRNGD